MRQAPLVVILGLVAACTPLLAFEGGEPVLICNEFVVPPGMLLRIDDMSVECAIASEVFDEREFDKVGVEATAFLRVVYPPNACPEALNWLDRCPFQDYVVGTGAARGLRPLIVLPGPPRRFVLVVGAGRPMHVFAGAGAALVAFCEGALDNTYTAAITAGSGRLIAPTAP
jgi:hypothetical protein